ncbi:hypothetical protein [Streptosporangium sp. NPDC051022]|uniref:hypothetical protein n=1 Tax=Streptosporangium sp. NPDC051022 TaxID=3155752 RepID=UPI00343DAB7B
MPKNSSAARREQARALAAAEGISHTAALRRLDEERTATVDTPQPQPLSLSLPYQVRKLRPAYAGQPAAWTSAGWCSSAEHATELADALVAWHGGARHAHVWDYSAALEAARHGEQLEVPVLLHQAAAAGKRPPQPERPVKTLGRYRPEGVGPDLAAEPGWLEQVPGLLWVRYALHVWSPTERGEGEWGTAVWCWDTYTAQAAADALQVGHPDGRYPWGAITGPGEWPSLPETRRTVTLLPKRALGERLPRCHCTAELDDPYEEGLYAWLTCTLEQGHVERGHSFAVATEEG